jgi:hypothetical protein
LCLSVVVVVVVVVVVLVVVVVDIIEGSCTDQGVQLVFIVF